MRAHKAIEALNNLQVNMDFSDVMAPVVTEVKASKMLLEQAVTFDFGQISPENEHTEFGLDLLSRRLLRLPYDVTFFSCGMGHFVAHMVTDGDAERAAELYERAKDIAAFRFSVEEANDALVPGTLFVTQLDWTRLGSLIPSSNIVARGHYPHNFELRWWHIAGLTNRLPHMTPVSVEDQQADACRSAGVVAGLVSMLLSKDVIKISIPASDKLNKAREKKGKPCIRDAYEIRLRFGGAQNAGASREPINGLGRKSPRMHWRRGHYRKHHLDPGRLIPIPPCLINASEEAEAILPKDYVLPARMGWNLRTAAR